MDKLALIEAFIAIADAGSVKGAAKSLHQTDAAISRKIQKLESALSLELIKRERSGAVLTEAGQQYYVDVKDIVAALDSADERVTTHLEPSGVLKVLASHFFAYNLLLPRLKEFRELYPKLQIQIETGASFGALEQSEPDLLYGISFRIDERYIQKRIAVSRKLLAASPEYLKKRGTPKLPTDLRDHDYITQSRRTQPDIITFKNSEVIEINPVLTVNSTEMLIQLAVLGNGIIYIYENMAKNAFDSGQLVPILEDDFSKETSFYVYYLPAKHTKSSVRAFVDFFGGMS